jgi:CheY-like chemotaxis protein
MPKENKMTHERRVLIVDDEPDYLATVGDSFRALSEGRWQIDAADSAAAALKLLQTEKIELVVLDFNMPVADGLQLLGDLQRQHPKLKKVLMTSLATEEKCAASLAAGADLFLEKPFSPEGMKSVFVQLCELLNWTNTQGFQGVLRSVGLADLVQMECLGRNSSILELFHEQPLGRIYIEDGQIIHAVCGEMSGERAFQKMLLLTGGTFELREFELPPDRTINRTWEFLLGVALQSRERLDQRAQAGKNFSDGAETISTEPAGRAAEMLICSGTGEVLYNWQCAAAAARVTLLQTVAQRAEKLVPDLQLGKLDRVEIQLADGRVILQPRTDRLIFARIVSPAKP